MLELRGIIRAARPDEVHLVISATTKNRDALDMVDRFEQVRFDRLLFTKLDESSTYGMMLNALVRAQRPLSFVGTGQDVPEDFERASANKLAHMIVGDWGSALERRTPKKSGEPEVGETPVTLARGGAE